MVDKRPEDLSVEELRLLLLEKRRLARRERLEKFRRDGRIIGLTPDPEFKPVEGPNVGRVVETPVEAPASTRESDRKPRKRSRLTDNILLGVEVLEHEEDPGLGAEIEKDYF